MTLSESSSLTPEQLRVAVAERLGWTEVAFYEGNNGKPVLFGFSPNDAHSRMVPDYPNDLNACHEMEQWIHEDSYRGYEYDMALCRVVEAYEDGQPCNHMRLYHATSTQRCRAFLAVTYEVTENRNE